jgi:uncharacterized protein involved in exopolysaccharide biosynthesis
MHIEQSSQAAEPTLADLVALIWRARWGALAGALLGLGVGGAYLLRTPKVYEAEAVLSPASQTDAASQFGGLLGQLGGVGSLLGINLPSQGSSQESLAALRSRSFASSFIESESLLPLMFPERWDAAAGAWRAGREPPSQDEALRRFDEKVRFIEEDRRTSMVSVRLRLQDRERVAGLVNRYVSLANEKLRQQAIRDAEAAIEYLRRQAGASPEVEVQKAMFKVMESQLTVAALARTRPDFAFRVVDPATEPDAKRHVAPKAAQVLALGLGSGLLLGVLAGLAWRVSARRGRNRRV